MQELPQPEGTHQHLVTPEALLDASDAENLLPQVALLTLEMLDLLLPLGQLLREVGDVSDKDRKERGVGDVSDKDRREVGDVSDRDRREVGDVSDRDRRERGRRETSVIETGGREGGGRRQ